MQAIESKWLVMNIRRYSFFDSIGFGIILHLCFPGLGHIFWREYWFGIYVFLITLLAIGLFFLTYLVTLPALAVWFLLGVPVIFYIFTFVDLVRTIRKRKGSKDRSTAYVLTFALLAFAYFFASPTSLGNFFWHNRPSIHVAANNSLSPLVREGDLFTVNRLAYRAEIRLLQPFYEGLIIHDLPERCDLIRFLDGAGRRKTGLVIGMPGEELAMEEGTLLIDGTPQTACSNIRLLGNWPLTTVGYQSILVAVLKLGMIESTYQVSPDRIIGRIDRLF